MAAKEHSFHRASPPPDSDTPPRMVCAIAAPDDFTLNVKIEDWCEDPDAETNIGGARLYIALAAEPGIRVLIGETSSPSGWGSSDFYLHVSPGTYELIAEVPAGSVPVCFDYELIGGGGEALAPPGSVSSSTGRRDPTAIPVCRFSVAR